MKVFENKSDELNIFLKTTDIMFPGISKDKILVFDIETTSFEAANGCVFMIGILFYSNGSLTARRYFSENLSEESEIIKCFIETVKDYTAILSYKGDSFDIPYLGKRLYSLGNRLLYDQLQILRSKSFDLYNEIHPLKAGLGFSSTKLEFLKPKFGFNVHERIAGENISKFYIEHISASKLKSLSEFSNRPENIGFISDYHKKDVPDDLAHISPDSGDRFLQDILDKNRENMEAVLYLLRLSHLFMMRKGCFNVELSHVNNNSEITFLIFRDDFSISLQLSPSDMDLKQFFLNYKDYYYFPSEDMAIHKSLAEFADSGSKKKATAKTAYRKVSGSFIHIPKAYVKNDKNTASTRYKISFEAEEYFLPADELLRLDTETLKEMAYYFVLEYASEHLSKVLISF